MFNDERISGMKEWKVVDIYHGYLSDYYVRNDIHVIVEDLKRPPKRSKIIFHLKQPWEAYNRLQGFTAPLRDSAQGFDVEVAIGSQQWDAIPNLDFHMGTTIAGIKKGDRFCPPTI